MKCFKFSFSEAPKTTTKSISRPSSSELNHQNVADFSIESTRSTNVPSISQKSNNLRVFTFSELKTATNKFSRSNMIGEGGFGSVYMGVIKNPKDSTKRLDVVVKRLEITYSQGHKEWVAQVNMLGVVEHPNLVKLVGYCAEDDERGIQRLLVYEFMPNRSVEDHLFRRSKAPLSWTMRLKVAQDAARGLAYLHEEMDLQIIFQEFKSSDILLDEKWNAKLSDFGMARSEPHVRLTPWAATVMSPMGTAAPEYIQTGYMSSKSDVWGYGVVLYELITGRRPLDRNRPIRESNLIEWVKSYDIRSNKFQGIIDPRLEGTCSLKSARKLATIADHCLNKNPKLRPKMSEVLKWVNELIEVSVAHEKTREDTTHEGERGSTTEPFKF